MEWSFRPVPSPFRVSIPLVSPKTTGGAADVHTRPPRVFSSTFVGILSSTFVGFLPPPVGVSGVLAATEAARAAAEARVGAEARFGAEAPLGTIEGEAAEPLAVVRPARVRGDGWLPERGVRLRPPVRFRVPTARDHHGGDAACSAAGHRFFSAGRTAHRRAAAAVRAARRGRPFQEHRFFSAWRTAIRRAAAAVRAAHRGRP